MAPRGPRRLGWRKILAAAYPYLFAMIYWANERHYGKETARGKAVMFLTFVTIIPALVVPVTLFLGNERLDGLETLYWGYAIAISVGLYWTHHHWLLKRRVGLRFLRRYETMAIADRRWIKLLTFTLFAFSIVALVSFMSRHSPKRRVPTIDVIDANALANMQR